MRDAAFIEQQHVIDQPGQNFLRDAAWRADGNTLGDATAALRVLRALERVEHRRETRGLHADDLKAQLDGARRCTSNDAWADPESLADAAFVARHGDWRVQRLVKKTWMHWPLCYC